MCFSQQSRIKKTSSIPNRIPKQDYQPTVTDYLKTRKELLFQNKVVHQPISFICLLFILSKHNNYILYLYYVFVKYYSIMYIIVFYLYKRSENMTLRHLEIFIKVFDLGSMILQQRRLCLFQ